MPPNVCLTDIPKLLAVGKSKALLSVMVRSSKHGVALHEMVSMCHQSQQDELVKNECSDVGTQQAPNGSLLMNKLGTAEVGREKSHRNET